MKEIVLYIVIPCYNEETVLPITSKMFLDKLTSLTPTNKISASGKRFLKVLAIDIAGKIWPPVPPPLIMIRYFLILLTLQLSFRQPIVDYLLSLPRPPDLLSLRMARRKDSLDSPYPPLPHPHFRYWLQNDLRSI